MCLSCDDRGYTYDRRKYSVWGTGSGPDLFSNQCSGKHCSYLASWDDIQTDDEECAKRGCVSKIKCSCECCKGKYSDCFITTATLQSLGKDDDCYELNTLRTFRDTYLKQVAPNLIEEYYEIAPSMVTILDGRTDKEHIYKSLYNNYLSSCLNLIEQGKYEETQELYIDMVKYLEQLLSS